MLHRDRRAKIRTSARDHRVISLRPRIIVDESAIFPPEVEQTPMILFNAASAGAYWERLPALPLEERRLADQEPPLEQRSEGQPGYLGESLLHLHSHRAPITATQPTDILLTDIRATHSRAMDIRATRDSPLTPVLRVMDIRAIRDSPLTPVLRVMDTKAARSILPTPVPVIDIPCLVIPPIALRRTGRLGSSMPSSLLAEFLLKVHPHLDAIR
jgi:hypothetical protein